VARIRLLTSLYENSSDRPIALRRRATARFQKVRLLTRVVLC
jgi:hypothetical protein